MLTIVDYDKRMNRRAMLQASGFSLASLGLSCEMLRSAKGGESTKQLTDKSVILLFLHGGPSQIETFDPKMSAPVGIQSVTGEIPTAIPGVTFGSSFPLLAERAKKLCIVRSFTTGDGNHDIKPVVGRDSYGANIGSLFARVAGPNRPKSGMPTNAMLFPKSVDPSTGPAITQFGKFESTGQLGSGYSPFVPGAGGELQRNLELRIPVERLDDRRTLLSELDRQRFACDDQISQSISDPLREQAFSTLLGGVAGVFDLSNEPKSTIERYDTAGLVRPSQISRAWRNYDHYVDNAKALGKLLLLARRLCEAGCGFVTVTTSFVWDMHADINNATVEEGMRYMGLPLDHAVAALLDDLEARGLSDRVMFVATGEMGRTPKVNKKGGRDHWGNLAPLLISGGGINAGQVIGQSSRDAGEPASEPIRIKNLVASMLQTLIDPGLLRLETAMPREVLAASAADPIPGLRS